MKVAIDIYHPADINFFKNSINILLNKGVEIELIVRSRGKTIPILEKELPNIPYKVIGKQYSKIHNKIIGGIKRELDLFFYLNRIKFDIGTAFGPEISFVCKALGKPSVIFTDDYEYKISFYLSKFAPAKLIIPESIPVSGKNIYKYKGFKELAYLHPKYFKPNKKILEEYNLEPNKYVFIREIADNSMNYRGAVLQLHKIISFIKEYGFDIIISLEDKSREIMFKENCFIINEPIEDIYSIMSFSALAISSGDTMAREACLVGVPTIYTGNRYMSVNKDLIEKGCMFYVNDLPEIKNTINYIIENNSKKEVNKIINYNLLNMWDDTTDIIVKNLIDEPNFSKKGLHDKNNEPY